MKTKILLTILITFFLFYDVSYSQTCAIEITSPANDTIICLGDSIWLRSEGSCDFFMNNGFENGLGVGWSSANANPTFPEYGCEDPNPDIAEYLPGPGPEGPYMWIGATPTGSRSIVTDSFDITVGNCFVKFWMRYGRAVGDNTPPPWPFGEGSPCEDPDAPGEGVHLQYSIDDGMTWIDFPGTDIYPIGENSQFPPFITYEPGTGGYWDPIDYCSPPLPSHCEERWRENTIFWWHQYSCPIPPEAISQATKFQYIQITTSGEGWDTWGLDEVMIFCSNTADTNVVWNHGAIGFNPDEPVYPISDTSYIVMVFDTLGNFDTDTVNITVIPYPDIDLGPDTVICDSVINTAYFDAGAGYQQYLWNTGETTQVITPNTTGLYIVTVTNVTCPDVDSVYLTMIPQPIADAGIDDSICEYFPYDFSNAPVIPSADYYDSVLWIGGLGSFNDPTVVVPIYYPAAGELGPVNLSIIAYGISPCGNDTSTMILTINPEPDPDFTISPNDTSCVGELITFNGSSTNNIISWDWDFGDGNTTSGQNVTHIYTLDGTFYISLIVIDDNGCTDTAIHQRVIVDPDINFTMNPSPSCEGYLVTFNGTGDASFTDWLWDFGDGNTAIGKNVTHTYMVAGTFTVTLDVCSKHVPDSITVHPPPVNDAGSDEATCEDVPFDFFTSTIVPTAVNYSSILWYGGQGTFDDPTSIVPIYTPGGTELGLVTLTMVAYGIAPCYNDTSQMVLNVVEGAYAQAGSDENSCLDEPYDFAGSVVVPFATNYDTLYWSGGAGYFIDPYVEVPVYVPAPGELGPVVLTMVASGFIVNCDSIDDMILTIRPTFLTPFDTSICYGDSVYAQGNWQLASGTFYDTLLSVYDCDSVIQTNLNVYPEIDCDFAISPNDSICIGDTVYFTQTGSANITSWLWNFGDGQTSTQQDPAHFYQNSGVYTVTLSYSDDIGCTDEKVKQVFVFVHPDVEFISSMVSACINAQVNFYGISNSNIVIWLWDFGDGQSANTQDVSHIYNQFGLFLVTLTVTADNGCSSSITHSIFVAQPPTADFEYYVVQCDTLQFTDLSTSPSGYYLVLWQWDFGDGDTSDLQHPYHIYDSTGIYNVTLVVTADSSGLLCNDTISQLVIVPALPTVYFTWSPQLTCLEDSTNFFGTSGNDITSWYWDFGDGLFSTVQQPTHMYSTAGLYNVILYATDINGCRDTVSHPVNVADIPDVDFTIDPNPACIDQPSSFSGISNSNITGWLWNFGDGGSSTAQNAIHTYIQPGSYTVTLYVSDTNSCTNSVSQVITANPLPSPDFQPTSPSCLNDSVHFTNYSTTPNGFIVSWLWDFGDGNSIMINLPDQGDVSHLYSNSGTFQVTLTVTDSDSCTNSISKQVIIVASPIADFNHTNNCDQQPVEFTDLSSPNGGNAIVSWFWEFDDPASGNSNTSILQNPAHIFSAADTFDVLLVIHNVEGCPDTVVKSVIVFALPDVDFTTDSDSACVNAPLNFYGLSTDAISWLWDFGDGGTSVLQDPSHVYQAAGLYTVTLTVVNSNNCSNSVSHQVYVNPLPLAEFVFSTPACTGFPVDFTDLSSPASGYIEQWHWYFGDGTDTIVYSPDNPNVSHVYSAAGSYSVSLTVTNSFTCIDSASHDLSVIQGPEANFDYSGNTCQEAIIQFNDLSIAYQGTIQSWLWQFGDPASGANNTSVLQNPTHVYDTAGSYDVSLAVTTNVGCTDIIIKPIVINPPPAVYFYSEPSTSCFEDITYFFVDPDSTNIAEVVTYFWDFDDPASGVNGTSGLQNPTHIFTSAGTYQVSLTITDVFGCENLVLRPVLVNHKPMADYSYQKACLSDTTLFFDESLSGSTEIIFWFWDFDDPASAPNNTSGLTNPTHVFSSLGDYLVNLIVTDESGCSDTIDKTVRVFDVPQSHFNFNQACQPPATIFFSDSSFAGSSGSEITEWLWRLEDDYYSNQVNPTYTYSQTDTCYEVTLTVTDENLCSNSYTNSVCVKDPLSVDFSANRVCLGEPTHFAASYLPLNDSIIEWSWDFGDGTPLVYTPYDTISYLYSQPGTYYVLLNARNTNNCLAMVYYQVTVDALPEPDFYASPASCDLPTQFYDMSTGGGSVIQSWQWDFGDIASGGANYSTLQNPSHLYTPQDSTYYVSLITTNLAGCIDSVIKPVVKGLCLVADFDVLSPALCTEANTCFSDNSYVFGDAYPISRWQWDFGDGNTSVYYYKHDSVCHVYSQWGSFDVRLIITANANGIDYSDTTYRSVYISPTPDAGFSSTSQCIYSNTNFFDESTGNGAPVTKWHWDFGDPLSPNDTSTLENPTYIYHSFGQHLVELIISNDQGCSDTIIKPIEIFSSPDADFINSTPCAGNATNFFDRSVANQANIHSWHWDFGDLSSLNDTSQLQEPSYKYNSDGYYTVVLKVIDENQCEDTINKTIRVFESPNSDFNIIDNYQNQQGQLYFENLTTGANIYEWYFGNGLTSQQVNPVITYDEDGTYIIQLIAWNEYNCPDTAQAEYTILLYGLYIPNAFAPEDQNPELRLFQPKGVNLSSYEIEIISTWGSVLWKSNMLDPDGRPVEGWDGTYKDKALPMGTYIWKVNAVFTNGSIWNGSDCGDGEIKPYGAFVLIR